MTILMVRGATVFVVEQDQGRGDDVAEAPGAAAVAVEGFVAGLSSELARSTEAAECAVEGVVGLLVDGEFTIFWLLERDREGFRPLPNVTNGYAEGLRVSPGTRRARIPVRPARFYWVSTAVLACFKSSTTRIS